MDSLFNAYSVFDFNLNALNYRVKNAGDTVAFSLYFNDSLNWDFTISKKEVFSENFVMTYTKPNGEQVAIHKGETNTYQGQEGENPDNIAYFYISNHYFKGTFTTSSGTYVIEQSGSFIELDGYVVYREEDKVPPSVPFDDSSVTVRDHLPYPDCSCYNENWEDNNQYYLELAFEMDCEFVRKVIWKQGMDEMMLREAVNFFLSFDILAKVSGVYEEAANMQVIGVYANWWLPALNPDLNLPPDCTGIDPYTDNETDIDDYLEEFRTYWKNNFDHINRDWAHMFTGLEVNALGVANSNSICGSHNNAWQIPSDPHWFNSYAVSRYDANWTTVAHELGHGFRLTHEDGDNIGCETAYCSCGIMEDECSFRGTYFTFYPCDNIPNQNEWPHYHTNHYNLCQYLNTYNFNLNHDNNACLLDPPPVTFDFDILIEDEQAILIEDDLICLNEEIDVDFFYSFGLNNFSWKIGAGLTLVSGTLTDPSIRLRGTSNLTSYICAHFDYNGNALTYCRDIHVGAPFPPAPPVIHSNFENGNFFYSVGFPPSDYATYYDYSFTVTNQYGSPLFGDNGTTASPDPLVWPLYAGQCVNISIQSGNECGLSALPSYDPYQHCFTGSGLVSSPPENNPTAHSSSEHVKQTIGIQGNSSGKIKNGQLFTLFPNPSSGNVSVVIPVYRGISELRIVDMAGRLTYHQSIGQSIRQVELDGSNWGSGTYKAQLIQGENIFQKKLEIIK